MLELYFLLVFMIVAAVVAVAIADPLSSVISLGALGLGLCLTFLVLKAPDVAKTLLVVEILSLIFLIRATLKQDLPRVINSGWFRRSFIGIGFGAILLLVAMRSFTELPHFGEPKLRVAQHYLDAGVQETGATNLVASVILDYRAFDTFGEATVLFTAAMAVLAVVRTVGRKKSEQMEDRVDE